MPVVLRVGPYTFSFVAKDCDEPRHMHVRRDANEAKLWLDPNVSVAFNHGFRRSELRAVKRITSEHRKELCDAWDSFCNG